MNYIYVVFISMIVLFSFSMANANKLDSTHKNKNEYMEICIEKEVNKMRKDEEAMENIRMIISDFYQKNWVNVKTKKSVAILCDKFSHNIALSKVCDESQLDEIKQSDIKLDEILNSFKNNIELIWYSSYWRKSMFKDLLWYHITIENSWYDIWEYHIWMSQKSNNFFGIEDEKNNYTFNWLVVAKTWDTHLQVLGKINNLSTDAQYIPTYLLNRDWKMVLWLFDDIGWFWEKRQDLLLRYKYNILQEFALGDDMEWRLNGCYLYTLTADWETYYTRHSWPIMFWTTLLEDEIYDDYWDKFSLDLSYCENQIEIVNVLN